MNGKRYSRQDLIDALQMLAKRLGRTPTRQDPRHHADVPGYKTYVRHFGSWRKALDAAGMRPQPRGRRYERGQLLDHLRDLAERLGKTPSARDVNAVDGPCVRTYRNHFGKWSTALVEAGLEVDYGYSRQELIDALRELARRLGRTPGGRKADADPDTPSAKTYANRFGSWRRALEVAGIPLDPRYMGYDRETLLERLKDLAERLGRTPSLKDVEAAGGPSTAAYVNHFGTWLAALAEAGLELRPLQRRYARDELLGILRALADELGRAPSMAELLERDDLPTPTAYKNRFGRWNAALEQAGLTPRRPGSHGGGAGDNEVRTRRRR